MLIEQFELSLCAVMGTQDANDPLKGVDWKAVGSEMQKNPGEKPAMRKRLPKKVRNIPDYYFLPRRSLPSAFAFYGSCIAGGVGAGMLLEMWINKKVKGIFGLSSSSLRKMEVLYGNLTNKLWMVVLTNVTHMAPCPSLFSSSPIPKLMDFKLEWFLLPPVTL
ncbi:krueppel-like factor [Senna tora]|uniref:Krueppel-like factor n=1 Tax=Senna tora TaxID=362788 RepID=A0A834W7J5_9FABA|nr:krueppel-like factor [Senna tora]